MTDLHYIVYDGACRRDTRQLLASLLRNSGDQEITLVLGIASLEAFSDENGHTVLQLTPGNPQGVFEGNAFVFNSFINKLFSDATHTVYREKLTREEDDLENEDIQTAHSSPGPSKKHLVNSLNANNSDDIVSRRREIIWMTSNLKELSLSEIVQTYDGLCKTWVKMGLRVVYATGSRGYRGPEAYEVARELWEIWGRVAHQAGRRWGALVREVNKRTSGGMRGYRLEGFRTRVGVKDVWVVASEILGEVSGSTWGGAEDIQELSRRSGTRKSATSVVHNCKGYIREEITLTPDAFRNIIVVFEKPTLNEVCVVCGEVVKQLDTHIDRRRGHSRKSQYRWNDMGPGAQHSLD
ncbi:hypothetical protein GG344DRAFT_71228 [Lentinula edodes]|nr:hypothetical protein GG344DRAFT_71228 [Lentinula edodes]